MRFAAATWALRSLSVGAMTLYVLALAPSHVRAQGLDKVFQFLQRPVQPATAPPVQPAPATPPEWSGESGASGHPLMTSDAIRAAAAGFRSCLEGLWPLAQKRGISRATYERNVLPLTPDLRIMD